MSILVGYRRLPGEAAGGSGGIYDPGITIERNPLQDACRFIILGYPYLGVIGLISETFRKERI